MPFDVGYMIAIVREYIHFHKGVIVEIRRPVGAREMAMLYRAFNEFANPWHQKNSTQK